MQTTRDLRRILGGTFENGVHDVRETFVLKVIVEVQKKFRNRVFSGSVSLEHSSTVSKVLTCQHCARNDMSSSFKVIIFFYLFILPI